MVTNKRIEDLELSVRSYNALRKAGVNIVRDLLTLDLNTVKHLGPKSQHEVQVKLNQYIKDSFGKSSLIDKEIFFNPCNTLSKEETLERIKAKLRDLKNFMEGLIVMLNNSQQDYINHRFNEDINTIIVLVKHIKKEENKE